MAGDVLDMISKTSNILGLWTIVAIIIFLILCWKRIYYVCRIRNARRGRIQSIQDKIRSLRGLDDNLDGTFSHKLRSSILDHERRLDDLSQTKISLWVGISALFRPDPCLRLLKELEADSKQTVQRMTDVRLIILDSHNARQTDTALPSAGHMSSAQTFEAGPTRQPAESTSHAVSSGHSTTIEYIARTGNLRHRVSAAISTEGARLFMSDESPSTSPPPLTASFRMPVPYDETPASQSTAVLAPQPAYPNPSAFSTSPPPSTAPLRISVPYPFQDETPALQSAALFAPQTVHSSSFARSTSPPPLNSSFRMLVPFSFPDEIAASQSAAVLAPQTAYPSPSALPTSPPPPTAPFRIPVPYPSPGETPALQSAASFAPQTVHSSFPALSTSPPPLNPPFRIRVPFPSPDEIPASQSAALLAPQTAHSSSSTLSTSPPPLTASLRMPVPCPVPSEIPASQSAALLAPQTAHFSSSAASNHPINPSPGETAALNSQPVTRPSSAGPPTNWFGPLAVSHSGLTAVRFSINPEELPPSYEGGPGPLSDEVYASMRARESRKVESREGEAAVRRAGAREFGGEGRS